MVQEFCVPETHRVGLNDHYGSVDDSEQDFLVFIRSLKHVKWNSRGFVSDKSAIYKEGTLLHLNPLEFGVVLMEAINYGIPYLAFDNGGTGEISRTLGLNDFAVDCASTKWQQTLLARWCLRILIPATGSTKQREFWKSPTVLSNIRVCLMAK